MRNIRGMDARTFSYVLGDIVSLILRSPFFYILLIVILAAYLSRWDYYQSPGTQSRVNRFTGTAQRRVVDPYSGEARWVDVNSENMVEIPEVNN